MSIFDHKRLTNEQIKLDIEGLRSGYYTDKYFANVVQILSALSASGYTFAGKNSRPVPMDVSDLPIGDIVVEAQIFNRRAPMALIAGVDVALAMVRHVAGYYDGSEFVETYRDFEIDAVEDGVITYYDGDPENVLTVLEIRGRYRDFAMLETPLLGVLSRASRIATNVYEVLEAANGKSVLFFPARFDVPDVQSMDGYAYWLALRRYNMEHGREIAPIVSTDAQAAWWGGHGGGTVPHALIACFLADTVETMVNFARYIPVETPRIVLTDFNNDTVRAIRGTLTAFWPYYREALEADDAEAQKRWTLFGIRLDTSNKIRDVSLKPDDPKGVSPALARMAREAINSAWEQWGVPAALEDEAKAFCRNVQIVVSGGFNRDKIQQFERENVPVDAYGVGSTFLNNDKDTNTDFTMDVVRVIIDGQWVDMPKVGRRPCDNPDLQRLDWDRIEME